MKQLPSIERLQDAFEFRHGKLFWKTGKRIGKWAGYEVGNGYRRVMVHGVDCGYHRVIFALSRGYMPTLEIDHINGDPTDNRPENLREATHAQNMRNKQRMTRNTSGVKGVSWITSRKKWGVQICVDDKRIYLGRYADIELAQFVYECAAEKYHGAFSRT